MYEYEKAFLEVFYNVPHKLVIKMPEYAPDKYKNSLLVKEDAALIGFASLVLIVKWFISLECFFCYLEIIVIAYILIILIIIIPIIISRIYTNTIPKVFEFQIDANGITINQNQFYSWQDIENEKTHSIGIFAWLDYSMSNKELPDAYKVSFRNKYTKEKIEFLVKPNFNEENYSSQQEIASEKPKESILSKLFYFILNTIIMKIRTEDMIPALESRISVANLLISYRKIFEILDNKSKGL